jgi:hypothetical protein
MDKKKNRIVFFAAPRDTMAVIDIAAVCTRHISHVKARTTDIRCNPAFHVTAGRGHCAAGDDAKRCCCW